MTAAPTLGLFGKGRMASAIAALAGDSVAWQVSREAPPAERVDVMIDASAGAAVLRRLEVALERRTPLVIGSTGWDVPDLAERVGDRIGVLVAPNFSITVAFYARLTRLLARYCAQDAQRDPYVVEHHHARKKDAPSGTARLLADAILAECPRKTSWTLPPADRALEASELSVSAVRAGSTFSSHVVAFDSPGEVVEIVHAARNLSPYAQGALEAARWLRGKTGVHRMDAVAAALLDPLFTNSPDATGGKR